MMTELKYNRCGDYLIPDMGLGDEDRIPLGHGHGLQSEKKT